MAFDGLGRSLQEGSPAIGVDFFAPDLGLPWKCSPRAINSPAQNYNSNFF
jgi:hypothetical protein